MAFDVDLLEREYLLPVPSSSPRTYLPDRIRRTSLNSALRLFPFSSGFCSRAMSNEGTTPPAALFVFYFPCLARFFFTSRFRYRFTSPNSRPHPNHEDPAKMSWSFKYDVSKLQTGFILDRLLSGSLSSPASNMSFLSPYLSHLSIFPS